MKLRYVSLLLSIAIAGCAAHAAGLSEAPKPNAAALNARPIPWKTGALERVPTTIPHLQVVVTPGFATRAGFEPEHFAWLTSGGSDVVVVFSGSTDDMDEMSNEINRRYFPTQGVPGDKRSFVILGAYKGPGGPPPPDPGGFPGGYVEMVMRIAFSVNIAQVQLDRAPIEGGTIEK